ncbi:MAG: SigB/SigF/SigG family RNA polymerase sigma factor [Actinomycetota bacterium]|nr:SigB/SigF/SigG family RNA polymerase sigma factor [Actinomycetota bacterium]
MTTSSADTANSRRARDLRVAEAFTDGTPAAELRELVVREYRPLVLYLGRRYFGRGEALEDLVQVAQMGLLNAVDRFDPERGVQFSTFAAATIVGELKRHLRDKCWSVRVPRRLQEIALLVNRALPELSQSLGRSPSFAEIAAEIGETEADVIEAVDAAQAFSTTSLDAGVDDEAQAPSETLGEIDTRFELAAGWADVAPAIRDLPERERRILFLRFFENKTQSEIAAEVGISQMHVSRILTQTLATLRSSLGPS